MSIPSLPRQGFILTGYRRDIPAGSAIDFRLATYQGLQKVSLPPHPGGGRFYADGVQRSRPHMQLADEDVKLPVRPIALRDFQYRPVGALLPPLPHGTLAMFNRGRSVPTITYKMRG
ncbi:hypothetical protein BG74_08155 [Sodalis-like endosymbiont of Proechinophthirus fluctus]|uniref:hypothetical protein n=1 Tax=Sodalis-like endosymbiont of Proechinophthirus fluctus TaxID=1462730 RepID=UPI0007A8D05E|nr:hypothetical protein [Sodalis-like endosymbiont of Proechinophthirus fluctus]KYP95765.1 hypothetical protein BG74_08155 [Sodalis-like endosymbiont of Proechinophthirus fluctus]